MAPERAAPHSPESERASSILVVTKRELSSKMTVSSTVTAVARRLPFTTLVRVRVLYRCPFLMSSANGLLLFGYC